MPSSSSRKRSPALNHCKTPYEAKPGQEVSDDEAFRIVDDCWCLGAGSPGSIATEFFIEFQIPLWGPDDLE